MKWRKIHELSRWTEYLIARYKSGRSIRGYNPDLSKYIPSPSAPDFDVMVETNAIVLDPGHAWRVGQAPMGALVAALGHWRVSNAIDIPDIILPFRLFPLIGLDAFTKPNSWIRRLYRSPIRFDRADQRYTAGFDALRAKLASSPQRRYSAGEFAQLGIAEIGSTLSGDEAHDFYMGNR